MSRKGRFVFDTRPSKEAELQRLIRLSEYYRPFMEQLFTTYKEESKKRDFLFEKIIDIGAGTGHTTTILKKIFHNAAVTYFDQSSELTAVAAKEAKRQGLDITFLNGDIHSYEFNETYDLVFSRFALKHLYDPPLATKRMTEILNPGGRIILMDKDVTANIWYPIFPLYRTKFMQALNKYNKQSNRGGDSAVGRKIKYFLSKNKIGKIELETVQTSLTKPENRLYRELYTGVYKNLTPELAEAGLITVEDALKDIANLQNFLEDEKNLAVTFDFIVTGLKE
jgi:ubiquinone/menaquinone biosynthesis C-methylase UbiE